MVKLITNLIEQEPGIQTFVRERLGNGITNREALEIFEIYYTVKGWHMKALIEIDVFGGSTLLATTEEVWRPAHGDLLRSTGEVAD